MMARRWVRAALLAGLHATIAAALALPAAALAAMGDLDPTFGTGGNSYFGYGFGKDFGKAVARQPDGKFVIAAQTDDDFTGNGAFTVIRLNADGTKDNSFGPKGDGAVRIATGGSQSGANSVALQSDGKIVAAGYSFANDTFDFAIARFNANGTLDTTFNVTGLRVLDVAAGGDDEAFSVAVQPDGKIVAGGRANILGVVTLAVVRLDTSGALDAAFDGDGIALLDPSPVFTGNMTVPSASRMLAVQTLAGVSRVLIVGNTGTAPTKGFIIRLAPDGSKDAAFGTSGVVSFDFFGANSEFHALYVDPATQQILVTGAELFAGADNLTIARMNTDGTLDTSFAGTGKASVLFPATPLSGEALTIDPFNNAVVAVGTASTGTGPRPIVARLTSTGSQDGNFPPGGFVILGNSGSAHDVVAANAGSVFLAGDTVPAGFNADVLATQILVTGSPDPAFGPSGNGNAPGDYSNLGSYFTSVAVQPDGKVIAAGNVSTAGAFTFGVARMNTDGSRDLTFGNGGQAAFDFGNGYNVISNVFSVAGNKVVATGFGHDATSRETFLAARFNADGTVDPGFGSGGVFLNNFSGLNDEARAAAVSPAGKIVLAGAAGSATFSNVLVLKLAANGQPDLTFSADGYFTFPVLPSSNHQVASAAVLPDESILVGGIVFNNGGKHFIAKVLPNATLDPTFGTGGVYVGQAIASNTENFLSILVQPDGRIIGAGMSNNEGSANTLLVRLLANGTPDPSFGIAGISLRSTTFSSSLTSAVLQPDGKIATVGIEPGGVVTGDDVALYRFNANGSPDAGFGIGGTRRTDLGSQLDESYASAIQPDGNLLVAGTTFGRLASVARIIMVGPSLTLSATQIAFGNRDLNTTKAVPVTIRNLGTSPLSVSQVTAQGAGFSQVNTCSTPVAPAGTCTLTISFTPTTEGFRTGQVTITSNAPGSPHAILLSGNGLDLSNPLGDADGDGVPNGIEPTVNLDPRNKDNDIFNSPRLFAMQQYRDFLGREGDNGGVDFWIAQLNTGAQTRGQMIENFFGSAEFQGVGAPVARLYFAYFLRIPDYGGLTFWINYYRAGNALSAISQAFATSQEFVDRYGALTNDQFVDLVYQNVLGRPADAGGKTFWLGQLNGGMTRGAMMIGFSESAEFQAKIFNGVYVTMMYVGMLRRSPDPGGFTFWTGYMDAGNSGIALINGFVVAPEYRSRFLP